MNVLLEESYTQGSCVLSTCIRAWSSADWVFRGTELGRWVCLNLVARDPDPADASPRAL